MDSPANDIKSIAGEKWKGFEEWLLPEEEKMTWNGEKRMIDLLEVLPETEKVHWTGRTLEWRNGLFSAELKYDANRGE